MSEVATSSSSVEFVDRIGGLYRDCVRLGESARTLTDSTERRVRAMKWNAFLKLVEIGESLIKVQEENPGEFETWMEMHQERLGFRLRKARAFKEQARAARLHGIQKAFEMLEVRERPAPVVFITLRSTKEPTQWSAEEIAHWREKLLPVARILFPELP